MEAMDRGGSSPPWRAALQSQTPPGGRAEGEQAAELWQTAGNSGAQSYGG